MDGDEFIDSEKFQENYIEDDNIILHNGKVIVYNNDTQDTQEIQEEKLELENDQFEIDYSKLYRSLQKNIKNNCLDLLTVKSDFEIYCNFVKFIDDFYK